MSTNSRNWPKQCGLRIGALNICSLPNKITDVTNILYNSGSMIQIFGVSESRCLEIHKDQVKIVNYTSEHIYALSNPNKNLNRVGICVYIHNNINYKRRTDLEHKNIECIWLKIHLQYRSFHVGFIYRNGKVSHQEWISSFSDMMDKVCSETSPIFLLGDLNIDLFETNVDWNSFYPSFCLNQIVNLPTRVTNTTSTLIDHIYTNRPQLISETCIPVCGISDHYPTFCTLKLNKDKINTNTYHKIRYRNFKSFKENAFLMDLSSTAFDNVFSITDPTQAYEFWVKSFLSVLDKHAPFIEKRVKQNPCPPWLTQSIREEMNIRDNLKKQGKHNEFKIHRNKVKSLIRRSKKDYINSLIENKSDSSSIWKAIKLLNNSNNSDNINRSDISADDFNTHFTNISENLKKKLPPDTDDLFSDCLTRIDRFVKKSGMTDSLEIPFLSVLDVLNFLKHLKTKKAIGLDNIHTRLLKIAAPIISSSLTYVYNLFIYKQDIPLSFKCAKCIPIFKSGSRNDPNNYRPISILSILCKPFEKHINHHLSNFFENNKLFHPCQSGFRKKHSCETALLNITELLYSTCDDSNMAGLVFVDFSKAFDMIDHEKLLIKLKHYNLTESSINLLRSYLTNRQQSVCISSTHSKSSTLSHGVPQGSILGPLLFNIYINDLPLTISSALCHLFADDNSLISSGNSVFSISYNLNNALKDLFFWCVANSMMANPIKSKSMLVCTRQKRIKINDQLDLYFDKVLLPQVSSHKLLGVIIDHNLTWANHTAFISSKLSTKAYQLNCIKNFLDLATRKLFYFAYIQPQLDYCSTVWGHCCKSHLIRLKSIQKRSFKLILKSDQYDLEEMSELLNILLLQEKFIFNDCILLHKIVYNNVPSYLSNLASLNSSHYFCNDKRVIIPFPHMDIMKHSFAYNCTSSWNKLPSRLRTVEEPFSFKHQLLNYLSSHKLGIG